VASVAALSAHAVFVGRSFLSAAADARERGVAHAIMLLAREIDCDMAMLGVRNVNELGAERLHIAGAT
jgi:L-lactate dehydrogenase (cytochrome)